MRWIPCSSSVEERIEPDSPRATEIKGHIAAIRSYTANLWGDSDRVFEMASIAEQYLPEDHLIAQGMAAYALAVTHYAMDDMQCASRASKKMLQIGKKLDRLLMILTALCDLATVDKVKGQLHQAGENYDRAYRWMVDKNGLDTRVRSAYEVGLADLYYQKNQLNEARAHAIKGIQFCQRFNVPSELVSGYITLMRVCQAEGDVDGALNALRDAEQTMHTSYLRLTAKILLRSARVRHWLAIGDILSAARWASYCKGGYELDQIALARLQLAKGHWSAAQRILEQQRAAAQAGGRMSRLIEILGLLAIALEAEGLFAKVDEILTQAFSLARSEGQVRVFLDLGEPFNKILARSAELNDSIDFQKPGIGHLDREYAQDLLDAFDQERVTLKRADVAPIATPLAAVLISQLTDREQEVLQYLSEGLTNKKIANRMVVAPSTVKQHLKNIYSKLDVHTRTQAVAHGRELGLL